MQHALKHVERPGGSHEGVGRKKMICTRWRRVRTNATVHANKLPLHLMASTGLAQGMKLKNTNQLWTMRPTPAVPEPCDTVLHLPLSRRVFKKIQNNYFLNFQCLQIQDLRQVKIRSKKNTKTRRASKRLDCRLWNHGPLSSRETARKRLSWPRQAGTRGYSNPFHLSRCCFVCVGCFLVCLVCVFVFLCFCVLFVFGVSLLFVFLLWWWHCDSTQDYVSVLGHSTADAFVCHN